MESKYYIKLGNLYLKYLGVDNECANTYFIREIDFNCYKGNAIVYTDLEVNSILTILNTIGIDVSCEEVIEEI